MRTSWVAGLPLILGLAGAAYQRSGPGGLQTPASRGAASDIVTAQTVVSNIHAIDQMEVSLGKLAEAKGYSPEVRRYGRLLARDHRLADQKVLSLARSERLTVTAVPPSAGDAAMAAKLQAASGKEFDRQFLAAMRQGHDKAIAMLTKAQGQLADANLRSLVGKLLPILNQHRELSQRLQGRA